MYKKTVSQLMMGIMIWIFTSHISNAQTQQSRSKLKVSENHRFLEYDNGEPFFWLGGTPWGMAEWLSREDVNYYLDHRKKQGFNLMQICLFWGKRQDDPINFTVNPLNAYGHQAFEEQGGKPLAAQPKVIPGGSSRSPNDYWDHVDYIVKAAQQRDMFLAILPVWGRRYVNAAHKGFSVAMFSPEDMKSYGQFLGERYQGYDHIIWVMGGDVKADTGGDFLGHYRVMAEGIASGVSGKVVQWDQASPVWDRVLMTYHPDGDPKVNSSQWFHKDEWLDFNMIETFTKVNAIYDAVQHDYHLTDPIKPTVMGEPGYEGFPISGTDDIISALQVRRQAYQSIFAGAAGFTYGGFRDENKNGPLFSPFKGWKALLDMNGAQSMKFVKAFCQEHQWPNWTPVQGLIIQNLGKGELQKVAIITDNPRDIYIYFPDASAAMLSLKDHFKGIDQLSIQWYEPLTGKYTEAALIPLPDGGLEVKPPGEWEDAILLLRPPK